MKLVSDSKWESVGVSGDASSIFISVSCSIFVDSSSHLCIVCLFVYLFIYAVVMTFPDSKVTLFDDDVFTCLDDDVIGGLDQVNGANSWGFTFRVGGVTLIGSFFCFGQRRDLKWKHNGSLWLDHQSWSNDITYVSKW